MKIHHEVGNFKTRLTILLLSLVSVTVMAGQSVAATTCTTCHEMPPLDSATGERIPSTGAVKGSHQKHVTAGAVAADCVVCHSSAAGYATNHSAVSQNKIQMTPGLYSKGTFFNQTSVPTLGSCSNASCHADPYSAGLITSPVWGTPSGCTACHSAQPITANGPATGSHTTVTGHAVACTTCHNTGTSSTSTPSAGHADGNIDVVNVGYPADKEKGSAPASCTTASCHPNVYGTGSTTTPNWGTTGNGCSACHSVAIDSTGPATGSHAVHGVTDCSKCHAGATDNTTQPSANHKDGDIDVANGYPANVTKHASGAYTGGTCSTASCHANVYGTGTVLTPEWGTTGNGCSACHTIAVGTTGSHAKHAALACDQCHAAGTTATTAPSVANGHTDGNVDVYYFGYPADVTKHAAGSGYGSCTTAYCHSNGNGTYAPPTWGGTSTGCNFCHPNLGGKHSVHTALAGAAYGNTADNSTAAAYNFGCGNCHPIDIGSHMNNTIDLTLNSTHGGVLKSKNNTANDSAGYVRGAGSVTCEAAYCHSNGMATPTFYGANVDWYQTPTGDKCALCHGNSPNSGGKVGSAAHGVHTVGIHYTDIFNGVSKKLPQSGGDLVNAAHGRNNRSTTINCNICHAATVTSSANDQNSSCIGCHTVGVAGLQGDAAIADKTKHVNGSVDIAFINQKLATKAQVNKGAFAAYTAAAKGWTRNNNLYKSYTSAYDVTKNTLFAVASFSQANGCENVACHSGIAVKWTDTVTCTNCHTRLK